MLFRSGFDELLSVTDIFFPNKTEALSITGTNHLEAAGKQLAKKSKVVAIKLGADGAALFTADTMLTAPSISVNVVDTVGAGDTFNAGFLYGFLNEWDLNRSLQLGTVCGALSTRASGGTTAQPTLGEALAYLR